MIGKFLSGLGHIGKAVSGGISSLVGKVKSAKDYVKGKLNEFAEKVPGVGMIYDAVANIPTPLGSIGELVGKADTFIDKAHARASKFHKAISDMSKQSGRPITEIANRIMSPDKGVETAPERQMAMDNLKQE